MLRHSVNMADEAVTEADAGFEEHLQQVGRQYESYLELADLVGSLPLPANDEPHALVISPVPLGFVYWPSS